MRTVGLVLGAAAIAGGAAVAAFLARDAAKPVAMETASAQAATEVVPLAVVPDVPTIQTAYADAKTEAADRHFDDLTIHHADCGPIGTARFYCQISYLRTKDDGAGHLYFTVVTMERGHDRWVLKSGLCRGDDASH